ncbi:S-layer homology domain-containing protein [Moorella naiadis]|uniref:DUF6612 family protein n=1 Tax=Moorella naiadis (nom. illeg.) TaxID=3093670 RepID=UPI003D9CACBE
MRKRLLTLVLALGLILALAPAALAATVTVDQLRQVFPQAPAAGRTLTRGEFAALLARAAGLQVAGSAASQDDTWYVPAVMTLKEKGVIRGYPDGLLHVDQPVTLLEGAVMASRLLALPDGVAAPEVTGSLGRDSWGYTPYAWLVRVGLLQPGQDAEAPLTVDSGIAFLSRVFGSDPQAEKIIQAAQQAQAKIKDLKFTGSMAMIVSPRPEAAGKMPPVSMQGKIESEINYPLNLHQKMDMTINLPVNKMPGNDLPPDLQPQGKVQFSTEQYLVDGTMYQKLAAPGMEKPQWMKLPKEALPDLEALIEQSRNAATMPGGVAPELKDSFHFQYLGEGEENGHRVHRIAYYGLINDWQTLLKALPGGLTPEMEQALNQAGGILQSISFWGVEAVGVEDNLTYASEMSGLVSFADQFQGEAMPLEAMTISMKVTDYQYDSGVKIEVPAEALAAPELPLTPPQPDTKTSMVPQVQG